MVILRSGTHSAYEQIGSYAKVLLLMDSVKIEENLKMEGVLNGRDYCITMRSDS